MSELITSHQISTSIDVDRRPMIGPGSREVHGVSSYMKLGLNVYEGVCLTSTHIETDHMFDYTHIAPFSVNTVITQILRVLPLR